MEEVESASERRGVMRNGSGTHHFCKRLSTIIPPCIGATIAKYEQQAHHDREKGGDLFSAIGQLCSTLSRSLDGMMERERKRRW